MSTLTFATAEAAPAATGRCLPGPAEVSAAIEAFLSAHNDAAAVFLTRAQHAGVEELPPGAELLFDEAQFRFEQLLKLTGLDVTVAAILAGPMSDEEIDGLLDAASEYTPRRGSVYDPPPSVPDWRSSVEQDWSQSRRSA